MQEWLHLVTKDTLAIIDAMALIVVAIGTIEAFFTGLRVAFPARAANPRFGEVFQRYGRWLVAGLTFELAADIIETSITPSWDDIGRIGRVEDREPLGHPEGGGVASKCAVRDRMKRPAGDPTGG